MKMVALAASVLLLSVLFALLEQVAASVPRRSIFRRERLTDFLWWFFTPTVTKVIGGVAPTLASGGATMSVRAIVRDVPSPAWFQAQHTIVQISELLFFADLLA